MLNEFFSEQIQWGSALYAKRLLCLLSTLYKPSSICGLQSETVVIV